jgi:hypothetical protein
MVRVHDVSATVQAARWWDGGRSTGAGPAGEVDACERAEHREVGDVKGKWAAGIPPAISPG